MLLVLGLLAIGSVVLILAAYHFGRTAEVVDDAEDRVPDIGDRVLRGQGFSFSQKSEGVTLFTIEAEESQQDRDGNSYLKAVTLTIPQNDKDGESYVVKSRNATVNETTSQARLEGEVVLSGWENFELRARALDFRQSGEVLESLGAVEFRFPPELTGRASKLRVDRTNDTITLSEGVHIHTVEGAERPMRLNCERLVYQRSTGLVRAVGEASLKSDLQSLAAHYLTIFLAEDGRTLESVRARWNVVGTARVDDGFGGVNEIEYRGEFLDVQPDSGAPDSRRIKLDGEGETVTLSVTDLTGLRRSFTGLYLVGHAQNDRLVQVEGIGQPIVLLESLALEKPFPLRRACAERVTARFLPTGGMSRVQFEKGVELNDHGVSMSGGQAASINMEDGMYRVEGDDVLLVSSQGEITSPQFTWSREKGIIRARTGVRALLADRSLKTLSSTPLGQGRGPIQVESSEAYWTTDPPTFAFEGDVRAWRGESLLLAEQLLGDDAEQKLAASGGVRTVWVPGEAAGGREPIEVNAGTVSYLSEEQRLVYHEDVAVRQGRRTIKCQQLDVELDPRGRAERMICADEVEMNDPETGHRVQGGDRAVYTLAQDVVEVFGEKVEIYDAQSNRMQGRYVHYDLRVGKFKIRSNVDDDMETESP